MPRRVALPVLVAALALAACSRSGEAKMKAAGADLKRAGVSTAAAAGKVGAATVDSVKSAATTVEKAGDDAGRKAKAAVHKATR